MNVLRSIFNNPSVQLRAITAITTGHPIDIKFLSQEVPAINDARKGHLHSFLLGLSLPVVSTATVAREWSAADQRSTLPSDRPWIEAVDLPGDKTILLPDESDPIERILLFTSTFMIHVLVIVGLELEDSTVSVVWMKNPTCYHTDYGIKCAGMCPNQQACRLVKFVGEGPRRAYCEC